MRILAGPNTGNAGISVWKWQRHTPQLGGGVGPTTWVVPDGQLTQTFAWGSREDGLLFDKFAFGPVDVCYTVGDLDAARAPSGTCPPLPPPTPPAYTRTGPPLAAGKDKFLGSAWSPGVASLNVGNYLCRASILRDVRLQQSLCTIRLGAGADPAGSRPRFLQAVA